MKEEEVAEEMAGIEEVHETMAVIDQKVVLSVKKKAILLENVLILPKVTMIEEMTEEEEVSMKIETKDKITKGQNLQSKDLKEKEVDLTQLHHLKRKNKLLDLQSKEEEVQVAVEASTKTNKEEVEAEAVSWERGKEKFPIAQAPVDWLNEVLSQ